jgi:hypothetical protein
VLTDIAAVCVQLLTGKSPSAVMQAVSCPHLACFGLGALPASLGRRGVHAWLNVTKTTAQESRLARLAGTIPAGARSL